MAIVAGTRHVVQVLHNSLPARIKSSKQLYSPQDSSCPHSTASTPVTACTYVITSLEEPDTIAVVVGVHVGERGFGLLLQVVPLFPPH